MGNKALVDGKIVDVDDDGNVITLVVPTSDAPGPVVVTDKDDLKLVDSPSNDEVVVSVEKEAAPKYTEMYLHGAKFLVTDEQKAKYDALLAELNKALGDTSPGDVPLNSPYYAKKAELDLFVAGLKR